jgi:hypothetical protein
MIDPLETVIVFLQDDAGLEALVDTRIAAKHRYADAWTAGEAALVVRLDGGEPQLYVPVQRVRIETQCYAASQVEAMEIWRRLVELSRDTQRVTVETGEGEALLHFFLQAAAPSLLWNDEVGMDFALCFFEVMVGEGALE